MDGCIMFQGVCNDYRINTGTSTHYSLVLHHRVLDFLIFLDTASPRLQSSRIDLHVD